MDKYEAIRAMIEFDEKVKHASHHKGNYTYYNEDLNKIMNVVDANTEVPMDLKGMCDDGWEILVEPKKYYVGCKYIIKQSHSETLAMLVTTGVKEACFICLETGNRYLDPNKVEVKYEWDDAYIEEDQLNYVILGSDSIEEVK